MEGDFIWPRALRSRAHMTVRWDSRRRSASRFFCSGFFSPGSGCFPFPVGLGRGAQQKMDQGERLSEPKASSSSTPFFASTAGCPGAPAKGTQTIGSPFLCLLSFGEAKESELPPGQPPANRSWQALAAGYAKASRTNSPLPALTPPSPRWAMEGDFIWPRALRSRAHMTVRWDSRRRSASRFFCSEFFSPGSGCFPFPVGLGRGAQQKMDQGERLSEPKASSSSTPFFASTAGCPGAPAKGTQTIGSPSLCLLSLGEARESESPAGARPGLSAHLPT